MLTILFYHASISYFLIIDFYFLIPAVTEQIFNSITEIVISVGIPSKEAEAETKTHTIIVEAYVIKCSV